MTSNGDDLISMTNSLSIELKSSAFSADSNTGRRDCTRQLNQLKAVLRQMSRDDCYRVISNSVILGDAGATNQTGTFTDDSIVATLFSIIGNENEFSTEGHRESSLEILKILISEAFCTINDLLNDDGDGNATSALSYRARKQTDESTRVLTALFQQCSVTFRDRMQRSSQNNPDFHFSGTGTINMPMESSEHIRLLLVELMLDISTYLTEVIKECTVDEKALFYSVSVACETLAKSAMLDPYPEVQRASCSLIETLAQLCPLAVRMNVTSLLLPLTGIRPSRLSGDQAITCFPDVKNSLFWHRHTKTRTKAVYASIAIVLCCPSESALHNKDSGTDNLSYMDCNHGQQTHLARHGHGSKSSSTEQLLNETVLRGWEELIKLDPSVAVRNAVIRSLGQVACMLKWTFLTSNKIDLSSQNEDSDLAFKSPMGLESVVETKVLSLLLFGLSDRNTQVRATALQTMKSFCQEEGSSCHWQLIANYYEPLLELALDQCSSQPSPIQSKVRSLEALQVLFSLTIPFTMDTGAEGTSLNRGSKLKMSRINIRYIIQVLSNAILSEENDVLDASLKCCRILGSSDELAIKILSHLSEVKEMDVLHRNEGESETSPDAAAVAFVPTPRRVISTLLLLDGLMKGYLSNLEMAQVLHDFDSLIPASAPAWFCSPYASRVICRTLSCDLVVNSAVAHSSLAWALLDACSSLVQCLKPPEAKPIEFELTEDSVVDIMTSITYLAGCPDSFGLSSNSVKVLDELSRSRYCDDSNESNPSSRFSLLDDYFRRVYMKINATAPFPWKRSDPAFLAINAFLRMSRGSTIRSNFDLIAPLFLYHLPEKKEKSETSHSDGHNSRAFAEKEDLVVEEYSLRMSFMSLLQAILSDGSFLKSASKQQGQPTQTSLSSQFSAQFSFDLLLSLVLPNLVWKSGGLAAALRKLSGATLFALLSQIDDPQELEDDPMSSVFWPSMEYDTYTYLLPILHSILDDTESTTRELSCACLSLIFRHMTREIFHDLWNTDTRVIDTLHPRLLALLDDSHNHVRVAACTTLERFLALAFDSANQLNTACCIGLSALENIAESLILTLDDPDSLVRAKTFQVLLVLVDYSTKQDKIAEMIERIAANSLKSHRDASYCQLLLQKLQTTRG
ncbi:hypothetical protein HJC23_013145 [Cyclotella cryptica]|uniref:MMS19 nucleotide excision repair protein n=1 Tax=Cyclotella cryptica TaxID=29204 RepID=A0ABD3QMR3_9STRA|eukprot:CCRYP_003961-RA/>CCRYP_003961-RA protein AED:0.02 eAED:0.02 QI:336/1/1/1/0/0/2/171/1136